MSNEKDPRNDFLLKLYETNWKNIIRTDDILWKVFLSYASVVLATIFLSDKFLNQPVFGILISLAITAIATCHAFNVNLWFLRNLVLLGNVEASFLKATDYGVILPKKWHPPYAGGFFNFKEFPSILGFIYPLFALLIIIPYWASLTCLEQNIVAATAVTTVVLCSWYIYSLKNTFNELKKTAPGPEAAVKPGP